MGDNSYKNSSEEAIAKLLLQYALQNPTHKTILQVPDSTITFESNSYVAKGTLLLTRLTLHPASESDSEITSVPASTLSRTYTFKRFSTISSLDLQNSITYLIINEIAIPLIPSLKPKRETKLTYFFPLDATEQTDSATELVKVSFPEATPEFKLELFELQLSKLTAYFSYSTLGDSSSTVVPTVASTSSSITFRPQDTYKQAYESYRNSLVLLDEDGRVMGVLEDNLNIIEEDVEEDEKEAVEILICENNPVIPAEEEDQVAPEIEVVDSDLPSYSSVETVAPPELPYRAPTIEKTASSSSSSELVTKKVKSIDPETGNVISRDISFKQPSSMHGVKSVLSFSQALLAKGNKFITKKATVVTKAAGGVGDEIQKKAGEVLADPRVAKVAEKLPFKLKLKAKEDVEEKKEPAAEKDVEKAVDTEGYVVLDEEENKKELLSKETKEKLVKTVKQAAKYYAFVRPAATSAVDAFAKHAERDKSKHAQVKKTIAKAAKAGLKTMDVVVEASEKQLEDFFNDTSKVGSKMIGTKFGKPAGTIANHSMNMASNMVLAYIDSKGVSRKAVLKKEIGKAVDTIISKKDESKEGESSSNTEEEGSSKKKNWKWKCEADRTGVDIDEKLKHYVPTNFEGLTAALNDNDHFSWFCMASAAINGYSRGEFTLGPIKKEHVGDHVTKVTHFESITDCLLIELSIPSALLGNVMAHNWILLCVGDSRRKGG
ncbi:hypothetical protein HK098_003840 [Nowakowskiella sp. JEL0407]|nr:hypothetical protein HK098_003840 [Nowakowskiella sp. JEL0407]